MSFARVRALVVIGVLTVAAVVFVIVALVQDSQGGEAKSNCPAGSVPTDLNLPQPQAIKIKVFNATGTDNWGSQVTEEFKNRKFQTQKPEDSPKPADGVAILRYGPKAVGAAWVLRAYFLDEAEDGFDLKRTDDVVDVVIGSDYKQLATPTEVNQSLANLGEADAPPGTCPTRAKTPPGEGTRKDSAAG